MAQGMQVDDSSRFTSPGNSGEQQQRREDFHGRTTFVIAPRLAAVVSADRILVLKKGRIIESGSHRELMARNGCYACLVHGQTRGLPAA